MESKVRRYILFWQNNKFALSKHLKNMRAQNQKTAPSQNFVCILPLERERNEDKAKKKNLETQN